MPHTRKQNNVLNHLCFRIFSSLKGQHNHASESKREYYVNASSPQQPNQNLVIALLITLWEKKSDSSTDHTNVHLFNYKTVDWSDRFAMCGKLHWSGIANLIQIFLRSWCMWLNGTTDAVVASCNLR